MSGEVDLGLVEVEVACTGAVGGGCRWPFLEEANSVQAEASDFWAVALFALAVFGGGSFSAVGGDLSLRCRWWVSCGQFLEDGGYACRG